MKAARQALSAKNVDAALTEGELYTGEYSDDEVETATAGARSETYADIIDPSMIAAGVAPLDGCSGYWCESSGSVYPDDYLKVWAPYALEVWGSDNNGSGAALKVVKQNSWKYMLLDDNEIDAVDSRLYLSRNSEEGIEIEGPNNDAVIIRSNNGSELLRMDGDEMQSYSDLHINGDLDFDVILVNGGGNVGIGTDSPNNKLDVKGTIRAYELILDTGWSDYVFDEDYDLMSLAEVEQYISENQRLPGMPSATEVQEHGLPVADSQALLLQKVEELTLHLIEQNKRIDELQARVAQCNQ